MDGDMKLVVELNNERPVELEDLAKSLHALGDEYRRYLLEHQPEAAAGEMKLYIKEIRSGSIISECVAMAPFALPLLSDVSTVISYAKWLRAVYDWLIGRAASRPEGINRAALLNASNFLEPVAKDAGSQINIGAISLDGMAQLSITINSIEANAAQNRAGKEIAALKEPVTGYHNQVVLYWAQARNKPNTGAGDRARIESIYRSDVKVAFASDAIKAAMLFEPEHPFSTGFVVDVQVETIDDKPVLYKVLRLHDSFSTAE